MSRKYVKCSICGRPSDDDICDDCYENSDANQSEEIYDDHCELTFEDWQEADDQRSVVFDH